MNPIEQLQALRGLALTEQSMMQELNSIFPNADIKQTIKGYLVDTGEKKYNITVGKMYSMLWYTNANEVN